MLATEEVFAGFSLATLVVLDGTVDVELATEDVLSLEELLNVLEAAEEVELFSELFELEEVASLLFPPQAVAAERIDSKQIRETIFFIFKYPTGNKVAFSIIFLK